MKWVTLCLFSESVKWWIFICTIKEKIDDSIISRNGEFNWPLRRVTISHQWIRFYNFYSSDRQMYYVIHRYVKLSIAWYISKFAHKLDH